MQRSSLPLRQVSRLKVAIGVTLLAGGFPGLTGLSLGECLRYSVQVSETPCPPFGTFVWGLNDAADMVGWAGCGEYGHAFVAFEGGPSQLMPLEGAYASEAYAINAQRIVGYLESNAVGYRVAFLNE